jgi:hypothetical protein
MQFFKITLADNQAIIINVHAYIIEIYKISFSRKDFIFLLKCVNQRNVFYNFL